MTIVEYKTAVIELFESGRATQTQWDEMANAVLRASEHDYDAELVGTIDSEIMPDPEAKESEVRT